jgi:hypothetical protein
MLALACVAWAHTAADRADRGLYWGKSQVCSFNLSSWVPSRILKNPFRFQLQMITCSPTTPSAMSIGAQCPACTSKPVSRLALSEGRRRWRTLLCVRLFCSTAVPKIDADSITLTSCESYPVHVFASSKALGRARKDLRTQARTPCAS